MGGRTACLSVAAAFLIALSSGNAAAQDYPNRPITWVVTGTPGSVTDIGSRTYAKVLSEKLGQQLVIDNKPGAGGIIGTENVARAKPDGYTLLNGTSGPFGSYPSLYKKLSFDPLKDFIPVHGLSESPMIMVVRPDSKFKSIKELVDYAKANPEKLNYSTTGMGSGSHLFMEMLQQAAGMKVTVVPYKGSAQQITDLMGSQIDLVLDYSVVVTPLIKDGKLIPIGITGRKRLKHLPDVATVEEQGYPGVWLTAWSSALAPTGTPPEAIDKLANAFEEMLKEPSIQKYADDNGANLMVGIKKDAFRDFIVKDMAKLKGVIDKANIRLD
ncbi:tripartite tricarboxylate transporter substrate binding protein [Bradyrhizobium sp. LHD-71]|uniref:Bug family tripartite tricarboxylate transporter substrate binding protein n=1 Tax=Bradyrhizobium sp. LHD-71 TaxID=3072141 RepID=UPI00280C7A17|nr:tripartite tricarboxylate transporter substrate binding protein [Bradyrhizobium sp. LHD-71]MDQ8730977.1 tripartite tricarboxylate transporter substrate binding protein [Bradyrhizobium sp. LHD-71]